MSEAEISVNPNGARENGRQIKPKRLGNPWGITRRSDVEWLALFKQQRDSGLSLIEFCAPRGMSHTSFSAKRTKLMQQYAIASFDDFDKDPMQLIVKGRLKNIAEHGTLSPPSHKASVDDKMPSDNSQTPCVRVVIDGRVVVEIPADLDPNWIAALVLKMRQDCNN